MLVHSPLVERVDLRRLGGSASGNGVLGYRFDWRQAPTGEKKLCPLARKGACDSAADRASGSVDHSVLVLKQHCIFLFHIAHGAGAVFAGPLTRAVTRLFGSRRSLLRAASFNINPAFCF